MEIGDCFEISNLLTGMEGVEKAGRIFKQAHLFVVFTSPSMGKMICKFQFGVTRQKTLMFRFTVFITLENINTDNEYIINLINLKTLKYL